MQIKEILGKISFLLLPMSVVWLRTSFALSFTLISSPTIPLLLPMPYSQKKKIGNHQYII
uniref:Uncharacterized protein n=1 Tax=Manihot esculenta TaxID=3983 RepID=A0A2C9VUU6_MANES